MLNKCHLVAQDPSREHLEQGVHPAVMLDGECTAGVTGGKDDEAARGSSLHSGLDLKLPCRYCESSKFSTRALENPESVHKMSHQ